MITLKLTDTEALWLEELLNHPILPGRAVVEHPEVRLMRQALLPKLQQATMNHTEETLRALQVATLKSVIDRINEHVKFIAEPNMCTWIAGVELSRNVVEDMIEDIEDRDL